MAIHRNEGYSCYDGAFPVVTPWAMSKEEYTRRSHEIPWPEVSGETIVVTPDWDPERFTEPASNEPAQEHVEPTDLLNHIHQDFDLPSS
jgi:hypothetical protein